MSFTPEQREEIKRRLRRLREKNGVRTLDPVGPSRTYEVDYYREIVRPVQGVSDMVNEFLLPVLERYEGELTVENGILIFRNQDVERIVRDALKGFDNYVDGFSKFALETAERFTQRNDDYHYRKFVQGVNRQFGINIADQMSEAGIAPILRKTAKDNVDLIVDLPKQYYQQITKAVEETLLSGDDFGSLRNRLEQLEGINKRRAKLIAVDQTGKIIGKLNQVRQANEGITRYQWDANLDDRTRPRHVENDGEVFDWSDTQPGKAFGRPGEEIRCRCTGRGVIDEGITAGRTVPTAPRIPTTKRKISTPTITTKPAPTPIQKAKSRTGRIREVEDGIVNNLVETGVILDDDGTELFRHSSGKEGEVRFAPSQLRKLREKTLTHNHPTRKDGGLGGNFSEADLGFFASNGLKELRAVDTQFEYKITGSLPPDKTVQGLKNATTRMYNKVYKEYARERIQFERTNGRPATREERDVMLWGRANREFYTLADRWGLIYERKKR